jgi:transposase
MGKKRTVAIREAYKRIEYYVGFDWAHDHHDIVVVDPKGQIVLDTQIDHDAEGWQRLRRKLVDLAGEDLSVVGVAIETNCGPAVERLLEMKCTIYPLNPKAAARYRDRKSPSGGKTDPGDAWSLADGLRTDGHGWRELSPEDPKTRELRLLCRDEQALIDQRTALVNELRAALHEYYPALLEAFSKWTLPFTWECLIQFPTPAALQKAGEKKWRAFLHTHRLGHGETYAKRMEIFARATDFCGDALITSVKSELAVTLAKLLRTLDKGLRGYRKRIEALFAEHPDQAIFASLPGAGPKLAPRLLGEMGSDRDRFADAESVQCYGGTAPVTYKSGQYRAVRYRRACNKHFRHALHLWAGLSRKYCVWAEAYYKRKREQGKSHACAARCLAQRWLKILWRMWQDGTVYNDQLHMRNQQAHGSWVLRMTG